jgi:pyruvate/2-oxoglutarate/acetoin dehydrogenase E1 component
MAKYFDELLRAMDFLGSQNDTVFMGQSVEVAGTAMRNTLVNIESAKLLELPVEEDFQLGLSIGMALNGFIPISIFPRWNFLLLATNQIVNHLDKMESMSDGRCRPKVIIRVAQGSENPVDPQDQHKGNFSDAFRLMCKNIDIVELHQPEDILPAYQKAYASERSTILVEFPDYGK